MWLTVN